MISNNKLGKAFWRYILVVYFPCRCPEGTGNSCPIQAIFFDESMIIPTLQPQAHKHNKVERTTSQLWNSDLPTSHECSIRPGIKFQPNGWAASDRCHCPPTATGSCPVLNCQRSALPAGEAQRELPEEVLQPEEESGPRAAGHQTVRPSDPGGTPKILYTHKNSHTIWIIHMWLPTGHAYTFYRYTSWCYDSDIYTF